MQIYMWIIAAFVATILVLSILILCCILIFKIPKNRLPNSKRSVIVRPETAKPINAFDESSKVFTRISSPSVIAVPEYPLHKVNTTESERNRSLCKKSNWMSNTVPRHALSGRLKQRNWHFVDRDPPSDESKSDYLDPLDLNPNQLHDIYITNNSYQQSRQTDQSPNNESTVTTYA